MPFVLDASMAMGWCFADESTPYSRQVLERCSIPTPRFPRYGLLRLPTSWPSTKSGGASRKRFPRNSLRRSPVSIFASTSLYQV